MTTLSWFCLFGVLTGLRVEAYGLLPRPSPFSRQHRQLSSPSISLRSHYLSRVPSRLYGAPNNGEINQKQPDSYKLTYMPEWKRQKAANGLEQQANNLLNSSEDDAQISERLLEVLVQLAQLGEADLVVKKVAQRFVQEGNTDVPLQIKMDLQRTALYAHSNQVKLSPRTSTNAKMSAKKSEEVLRKLIAMSEKEDSDSSYLVASDFSTVVGNHLSLIPSNVDRALTVLRLWQKQLPKIDPPTVPIYTRIIRCIANLGGDRDWDTIMNDASRAMELGERALLSSPTLQDDNNNVMLGLYNALLEVWSKVLPTPSRQKQHRCFTVDDQAKEIVGKRTSGIRKQMKDAGVEPNFQTHAASIYAYTKCGWLDEAWSAWGTWKQELLFLSNDNINNNDSRRNETVDVRCLKMLVQSTIRRAEESRVEISGSSSPQQYAEMANGAIEDMWVLYEQGYSDMHPDVHMYTSLLRCWSNPQFKTTSLDYGKMLVEDLNERYRSLRLTSLQPNMAFYDAWMNVLRNQFENSTVSVAEHAGAIVQQMEHQSIDNSSVTPDTGIYNFLIDACLSDDNKLGVERAVQTLEKMLEISETRRLSPNGRSFASVISALSKFDTSKAELWLDRMEERFIPSASLFKEVIRECCEEAKLRKDPLGKRKQSERALRLLQRMDELSQVTKTPNLQPDSSLYDEVTEALMSCDGDDVKAEIESLRRTMKTMRSSDLESGSAIMSDDDVFRLLAESGGESSGGEIPTAGTLTFNMVLRHLANLGEAWTGEKCEAVFSYMLDQYVKYGREETRPDLITFNTVLAAWSKSSHPEAASRAHMFLDSLKTLHEEGLLLEVTPDLISYNTLIDAWQRSDDPGAAEQADRIFEELNRVYEQTGDEKYRPDKVTYCSLLGAYATTGNAHKAEEILLRLYKDYQVDQSQLAPDTGCFDQVLLAWAKKGNEQGAKRAELLLKLMEDMSVNQNSIATPSVSTYNIVLFALSNSGDFGAPIRAQSLLQEIKKGGSRNSKSVRPDTITYTTIIAVWCRLGGRQALQNAEKMIKEAIEEHSVNTDAAFFANVLSSLAFCGENGVVHFAENLVQETMPKLGIEPNIMVWNGLLNCLAKKGLGKEAEAILTSLEDGSLSRVSASVKPTLQSYTIVLDAYAKSLDEDSIARAEAIIHRMQESREFQPDVKAYTALIQKYARSNLPWKAKRAHGVLQMMKEGANQGALHSRPSVVSYNALLNACEFTNSTDLKEKEEAFTVACLVFEEVRKVLNPNHVTYGTFLGVISNLMPKSDARSEIAELVFKRCCKDGQVSAYVLRKLKTAVSLSRYRQMLGGMSEDRLPRNWTANVRDRKGQSAFVRRRPTRAPESSFARR